MILGINFVERQPLVVVIASVQGVKRALGFPAITMIVTVKRAIAKAAQTRDVEGWLTCRYAGLASFTHMRLARRFDSLLAIPAHATACSGWRVASVGNRVTAAARASSSYVAQRRARKPSQNSDGMLSRLAHDRVVLSGTPKIADSLSAPTFSTISL